ncbi:OB-fold domain-containing protein [Corynebacterium nasicanis]|uniref:OB-fold domain-containing protein n=1 Tax=Corynebacterium nasicanis TaxID=1448267 RepID=A0ABW1QEK7_9CORY
MTSTVVTYTIVRTPPQGVEGAPYCVAIVDTDGHRETARVAGYTDGREVRIGQTLRALDQPDEFGARYSLD